MNKPEFLMMTAMAAYFGLFWLIAGFFEMRTAIRHAKQYGYQPPMTGSAWYWLAISAASFVVAILIFFFA